MNPSAYTSTCVWDACAQSGLMESILRPHVSTAFLGSAWPDTWMSFQLHLQPLFSLWSCPESPTRPLIPPTFCSWKPLTATIMLVVWAEDGAEYNASSIVFTLPPSIALPRKGNWDTGSAQLARNTTKQAWPLRDTSRQASTIFCVLWPTEEQD